ncbi:hypothetical protein FRC01_001748, partial [Tulasnella sp. 417]
MEVIASTSPLSPSSAAAAAIPSFPLPPDLPLLEDSRNLANVDQRTNSGGPASQVRRDHILRTITRESHTPTRANETRMLDVQDQAKEMRRGTDRRTVQDLQKTVPGLSWMGKQKDKKAVDAKKAEIKHQLARQGMIRGQAKTPATAAPHHHHQHGHQRNPSTGSQRNTYLNIPGLQRSTENSVSRRSSASPSPSSNTLASSSGSAAVPIRTRPERLAKTQAKAALRVSPDGTEASGNSDEDEELGSGSDDAAGDESGSGHRNRRSANTSIDVDHPMPPAHHPHHHHHSTDSGKIGGAFSEVPKLFDASSVRGPASSTATPSFPNSPLHVSGGLGDLEGGFS